MIVAKFILRKSRLNIFLSLTQYPFSTKGFHPFLFSVTQLLHKGLEVDSRSDLCGWDISRSHAPAWECTSFLCFCLGVVFRRFLKSNSEGRCSCFDASIGIRDSRSSFLLCFALIHFFGVPKSPFGRYLKTMTESPVGRLDGVSLWSLPKKGHPDATPFGFSPSSNKNGTFGK